MLAGIVAHPAFAAGELTTDFLDDHRAEILAAARPHRYVDGGPRRLTRRRAAAARVRPRAPSRADAPGTVVAVDVAEGDTVRRRATLVVLEAMKMEHVVTAPGAGTVGTVAVRAGDTVAAGEALLVLAPDDAASDATVEQAVVDLDHVRPDLAEVLERHAIGRDERRPAAVARRHGTGLRTARENLAELCDPGSFVEYGALAIAAQRRRRSLEDLVERTPADGMIAGTATINADLFGAEHAARRRARLRLHRARRHPGRPSTTARRTGSFEIAEARRWPVVLFAEGGGGRPGDTDGSWASMLDVPAFEISRRLSARVPLVAVVAGRCFAGNAALAGMCDVIIAVEGASLGMGGPAMIEGGGLGVVAPDDVGPMAVQVAERRRRRPGRRRGRGRPASRGGTSRTSRGRSPTGRRPTSGCCATCVPENRVRVYDVRAVVARARRRRVGAGAARRASARASSPRWSGSRAARSA